MKLIMELDGFKIYYYSEAPETPWVIENTELMKDGKDKDEPNSVELSDKQMRSIYSILGHFLDVVDKTEEFEEYSKKT